MDTVDPSDLQRVEGKLDKILSILNGNGTLGLITRLALLEEWRERCEAEKQAASKDLKSIVAPLLTQFLGGGIMLAIYVIAGHALGILH